MALKDGEERQPRELISAEVTIRDKLNRWKGTLEKQITEGKSTPVIKESFTRAKGFYNESFHTTEQAIAAIEEEDLYAAAQSEFEDWEQSEMEWQDEMAFRIQQIENPTPMVNAQLTQAGKKSRFELLHSKAKTRADGAVTQLNTPGSTSETLSPIGPWRPSSHR